MFTAADAVVWASEMEFQNGENGQNCISQFLREGSLLWIELTKDDF